MPATVFPQVRTGFTVKLFSYPQLGPQAVHKEEQLMHSLSTALGIYGLGGSRKGRYRC
jgi:hypothetical protein